jgi:hypothetical protein
MLGLNCGIGTGKLPWCEGKPDSTQAYLLFLAHWARKLFEGDWNTPLNEAWSKPKVRVRL